MWCKVCGWISCKCGENCTDCGQPTPMCVCDDAAVKHAERYDRMECPES